MAKQQGRYSEQEIALIKTVFSNEDLLKSIQKVFLQLPLNALDLSNLQTNLAGKKEIHKIMRKMFLPQLTDDVPYKQFFDLTMSLDFKNKAYEEVVLNIKSNEIVCKYLDQQLTFIENDKYQAKPKLVFSKLTKIKDMVDSEIFVNVMARNNIVGTVSGRLGNLFLLATQVEKTPEQLAEEARKNSSK